MVTVKKCPLLEEYVQTHKYPWGMLNWYKTEKYAPENALRVAIQGSVISLIPGGVDKKWEARVDIRSELQLYHPTKVLINRVTAESKWSGSGVATSDVNIYIYDAGHNLLGKVSIDSDQDNYKQNSKLVSPEIDVTNQTSFIIEVIQKVAVTGGGNDVRTRYATIEFEFETSTNVHSVLVRCVDEEDIPMYGTHLAVDGQAFELPTGEGTIDLPAGDYEATAYTFLDKKKYEGTAKFTVPIGVVTITLKPKTELPWWWWIPVAAAGLAAGLGSLILIFKRPTKPQIIVVK